MKKFINNSIENFKENLKEVHSPLDIPMVQGWIIGLEIVTIIRMIQFILSQVYPTVLA